MTVTDIGTRRKWTPIREVGAEWTLGVTCPWCRSRFTVEVCDALGPITPVCCGGPALRILAAKLPGSPY